MPFIHPPTALDLFRCLVAVALICSGLGVVVHTWRGDTYNRGPLIILTMVLAGLSLWLTVFAAQPLDIFSLLNGLALLLVIGFVVARFVRW